MKISNSFSVPVRTALTLFAVSGLFCALAAPLKAESLNDLLLDLEKSKMKAVMKFVEENPESDDLEDAYALVFKMAINLNEVGTVVPLAKKYLEGDGNIAEAKANAILIYDLMNKGELEAAADRFATMIQFGARRDPNTVGSCGFYLADDAQLANKPEIAKEVLKAMVERLPLLPSFNAVCQQKIKKLDLVNNPAPELTVTDLEESPVKVSDYEGKVLLIDFWGTFCQPCIKEFPGIVELYEKYHEQGLEVVGISLDDSQDSVEVFQEEHRLPWRLSLGVTDENATLDRYFVTSIPATYLVGRDGKVLAVDLRGSSLRKAIEAQFAKDSE